MKLRVVKTGGSLLLNPQLATNLRSWRAAQPPSLEVHICGCGTLADVVRQAAAVHALSEQTCHVECLKLLSVTAMLLARISGIGRVVDRLGAIEEAFSPGQTACVYDASTSWSEDPSAGFARSAPASWEVTTDSIAALLCVALGGDELVLLKSADAPSLCPAEAAAEGYVDAYFPVAAAAIPRIRCVNLKDAANGFPETVLQREVAG